MRWLFHFLVIVTVVTLSVLFRWLTDQEVSIGYVVERTLVFSAVVFVVAFISRRDARRGKQIGRGWLWFGAPLFGMMTAICLWRLVVALTTQRVLVGLSPEAHVEWAQNPWGFAAALALGAFGAAMFGLFFFLSLMDLLNSRGPRY